jgi:hypothetical protein
MARQVGLFNASGMYRGVLISSVLLLSMMMMTTTTIGSTTVQTQVLAPDSSASNARFGTSLAQSADGSTIVVGAVGSNNYRGSVYVYRLNTTTNQYNQTQLIGASSIVSNSSRINFGTSVALSADASTLLVGADGVQSSAGRVIVFMFNATSRLYNEAQILFGSDALQRSSTFGSAVAMSSSGSVALVAAPGVNSSAGAVYVFERLSATRHVYNETAVLYGSAASAFSAFGTSVALSSDGLTALVGAPGSSSNQGSVYVYQRPSSSSSSLIDGDSAFVEQQLLNISASPAGKGAFFGSSVALSSDGSMALIGSFGVALFQGRAFVYERLRSTGALVYNQTQVLTSATPAQSSSFFGISVALASDASAAVVGAMGVSAYQGRAYLYQHSDVATFDQTDQLKILPAPLPNSFYGASVAIQGSRILVGAYGANNFRGAVYINSISQQ